jgi:hypothetical protein
MGSGFFERMSAGMIAAAAIGVCAGDAGRSAPAADASNGKRGGAVALGVPSRYCQPAEASADAPPFEEIAKRPNFTERGLATFLVDAHAKMPNMNLTHIEADEIAAYIGTLR